jgi:RNA polymerase sigma factor for flagellar operon FliA
MTLWQAYQSDGDMQARDELISQNLRLVYHVAGQIRKTCPRHIGFDELVSAGTVGLMNAIDTFDPNRGLAFSTLAATRIRGAILDDLRKQDAVPRSVRKRQKEVAQAERNLSRALKRMPTAEETAQELGIELEEYWKWNHDLERGNHISLDQPRSSDGANKTLVGELNTKGNGADIEDLVSREEEIRILMDKLGELKPRERVVLSLYYFEGLMHLQIAIFLGVSESRVSQIRSKAISELRARMGHLREGAA